jgi:hypothetical protein
MKKSIHGLDKKFRNLDKKFKETGILKNKTNGNLEIRSSKHQIKTLCSQVWWHIL